MNRLSCADQIRSRPALDAHPPVHRRGLLRAQRHQRAAEYRSPSRCGGFRYKPCPAATDPSCGASPISFAIRPMISRSGLVPSVAIARFSRCTSPQTLVTVPFFSYALPAGQNHVGPLRGLGQEHILHHHERAVSIAAALLQRIRAHHPERVEVAARPASRAGSDPARSKHDSRAAVPAPAPYRSRRANSNNRPARSSSPESRATAPNSTSLRTSSPLTESLNRITSSGSAASASRSSRQRFEFRARGLADRFRRVIALRGLPSAVTV